MFSISDSTETYLFYNSASDYNEKLTFVPLKFLFSNYLRVGITCTQFN